MADTRSYAIGSRRLGDAHGGFEVDPEFESTGAFVVRSRGSRPAHVAGRLSTVAEASLSVTQSYETPRLLMRPRKKGRPPLDCQFYSGLWFVSLRFKQAIEAVDPQACDMRLVETIMPDGSPGPEY